MANMFIRIVMASVLLQTAASLLSSTENALAKNVPTPTPTPLAAGPIDPCVERVEYHKAVMMRELFTFGFSGKRAFFFCFVVYHPMSPLAASTLHRDHHWILRLLLDDRHVHVRLGILR